MDKFMKEEINYKGAYENVMVAFEMQKKEIERLNNIIDKAVEYIEEYCIDDEFYVNLTKKEKNIIEVLNILKGDEND